MNVRRHDQCLSRGFEKERGRQRWSNVVDRVRGLKTRGEKAYLIIYFPLSRIHTTRVRTRESGARLYREIIITLHSKSILRLRRMIMIDNEHYDLRVLIKYYNDNGAKRSPSGGEFGDRGERRKLIKRKSLVFFPSFNFFSRSGLYVIISFHDCRYLHRATTTVTLHLYKATLNGASSFAARHPHPGYR